MDNSSERWLQSLIDLAGRRGDPEPVWRRAADICRNLNLAPWIALGVAERLISLQDAALLDRAARCKELQAAVLDQRKSLADLRTALPYAPYLLAAELVDRLGRATWRLPEALEVARALLLRERQMNDDGTRKPVRQRSFEDYAAAAERIRTLMERERCDLPTAINVETGMLDPKMLREYTRRKRSADSEWRQGPRVRFAARLEPGCGSRED